MRSPQLTLAAVLAVIGILALIAGIIYLSTPISSLPSFFPGASSSHALAHSYHNSRGLAGVIFAIILFVIAAVLAVGGARSGRRGRRMYR
jgi:hypothetical protein